VAGQPVLFLAEGDGLAAYELDHPNGAFDSPMFPRFASMPRSVRSSSGWADWLLVEERDHVPPLAVGVHLEERTLKRPGDLTPITIDLEEVGPELAVPGSLFAWLTALFLTAAAALLLAWTWARRRLSAGGMIRILGAWGALELAVLIFMKLGPYL